MFDQSNATHAISNYSQRFIYENIILRGHTYIGTDEKQKDSINIIPPYPKLNL